MRHPSALINELLHRLFPQINTPQGWNIDPEELDYEEHWAKDDSDGQKMAKRFNLERARPILCCSEEDGNKFYFWNEIAHCFRNLKRLPSILALLPDSSAWRLAPMGCLSGTMTVKYLIHR